MKVFLYCEGETERWYFEWLQNKINHDNRTKEQIKFVFKKAGPSSFAKSNRDTYTKGMLANDLYGIIQDIEDYSQENIAKFNKLLKSCKEAEKLLKKIQFIIGYSNFCFEVWIIAHRIQVKSMSDRNQYYRQINKAYGTTFTSNGEYKRKKDFNSILAQITLDDVINRALPECKRFKTHNYECNSHLIRTQYGFTYILNNPDTTLNVFVEKLLTLAGIITA